MARVPALQEEVRARIRDRVFVADVYEFTRRRRIHILLERGDGQLHPQAHRERSGITSNG